MPELTSLTQGICLLLFFNRMSREFTHPIINRDYIRIIHDVTSTSNVLYKIPWQAQLAQFTVQIMKNLP